MEFKLKIGILLGILLLSGCGQASVSCSDDDAKSALESAIRENLEKIIIERAKTEDGSKPISNSAIRASIATIKLAIENIRTTKEDPDSTKRFCTGSLKIVFSTKTFSDASKARELIGLTDVEKMADAADIEKGADYLKGDLDYNVQPTDDGQKIYAEVENADDKLQVFGEVVAASLLKPSIETQARNQKEQDEFALSSGDDPTADYGTATSTIRAFYSALGSGEGDVAASMVVPEKTASGPFSAKELTRYYGNMRSPIQLLSVSPRGVNAYAVRYKYAVTRTVCNGRTVVEMTKRNGRNYIARIRALDGC